MATGIDIDLSTGIISEQEVGERPPSSLRVAEKRRVVALERLLLRARQSDSIGAAVYDLLELMGYDNGR